MNRLLLVFFIFMLLISCSNNKQIIDLSIPYKQVATPTYKDNYLYIPVNKEGEFIDTIIKYGINGKSESSIFSSKLEDSAINNLQVNNEWMIWVESESTGANNKIYAKNIQSSEIKVISESDPNIVTITSPILNESNVAWIDIINRSPVVVHYDLIKQEKKTISEIHTHSFYNNWVDLQNGKILWTDSTNNKGYYFIYDIKNEETFSYEAPFVFPGYAKLSNNYIFSINFNDHRIWTNQEFGVFNITNKNYLKLRDGYISRFSLHGDNLAIINSEQNLELYKISTDTTNPLVKVDMNEGIRKEVIDIIEFTYDGKLIIGTTDISGTNLIQVLDY